MNFHDYATGNIIRPASEEEINWYFLLKSDYRTSAIRGWKFKGLDDYEYVYLA